MVVAETGILPENFEQERSWKEGSFSRKQE